ncbi:MAG: hypothetical protein Q9201_000217 [Fulgogasparrea decipioides]
MSDKFDTILIIGGTSGLGEGFARRFHAQGKKVIVTGRREDRLGALERELPGLGTQRMDTEDIATLPNQVGHVLAAFPNIDTVMAMAGIQKSFDFKDPRTSSPQSIQSEVTINVTGPMVLAQLIVPHLLSLKRQTTVVELAPPYVDTALDAAHRTETIEAQGGEENAVKPMPLEAYLDTAMAGFKQEDANEITTGFSEMGASTWRKAFNPILQMMGTKA